MDHISNRRHGVVLPENYWRHAQWHDAFEQLELTVDVWRQQFGLYPFPASLVFGRGLHFLARLTTGP